MAKNDMPEPSTTVTHSDVDRVKIEEEREMMMKALENMVATEASHHWQMAVQVSIAKRILVAQQDFVRRCESSLATASLNRNVAAWAFREVLQLQHANSLMKERLEENPLDDGLLLDVIDHSFSRRENEVPLVPPTSSEAQHTLSSIRTVESKYKQPESTKLNAVNSGTLESLPALPASAASASTSGSGGDVDRMQAPISSPMILDLTSPLQDLPEGKDAIGSQTLAELQAPDAGRYAWGPALGNIVDDESEVLASLAPLEVVVESVGAEDMSRASTLATERNSDKSTASVKKLLIPQLPHDIAGGGAKHIDESEELYDANTQSDATWGTFSIRSQYTNDRHSHERHSHDNHPSFEVQTVWKKAKMCKARKSLKASLRETSRRTGNSQIGMALQSSPSLALDETETERKGCQKYMIHPNNTMRTIWDVASLILVSYDTVTIPLELFDPAENDVFKALAWITRIFWSLDMPLSFMTGFIRGDGTVELSFPVIAKHYLLTWWTLDAALIAIDWLEVFLTVSKGVGFARVGKASRTFRVVRMMRLMRLIRITQVLKGLMERIISDILLILSDILKSMAVIMGLAHLCACAWYGISMTDPEHGWVASMPRNFAQEHLSYRYAASLHWSLSQFSGGMDEIVPKTFGERMFAILIYLLAFVVAAIFVSGLTSSMTRLVIIGSHQSQQLATLRRYLWQQGISNTLCMRIQRNAAYALSERMKLIPEDKIDLFHFVSEPLKVELHFEIYSPVLSVHPFFFRYIEDCPAVMRKVCHAAVQTMQVSHNDVLFSPGEIPIHPKVYFIKTGLLQYVHLSGEEMRVVPKMWVCEAALWTNWIHRGQLTAITDCRLFALDCKKFQDISSSFEHHAFDPKKYAIEFVKDLNTCSQNEITDLPFEEERMVNGHEMITNDKMHNSVVVQDTSDVLQIKRKSVSSNAQSQLSPQTGQPTGQPERPTSKRMSYLEQGGNYALARNSARRSRRESLRNSISAVAAKGRGSLASLSWRRTSSQE